MKLLTVDVEAPLPDVPAPTVGEQWVLVRFHREPLGILEFTDRGCSSDELSRLVHSTFETSIKRHLAADWLESRTSPISPPFAPTCPRRAEYHAPPMTVAVCTRNGTARLPDCLAALVALDYPDARLDLLVVDNAPEDESARLLIERQFPRVRYVVEPRPGLDWARNRAVLEAYGEVLAFTDDDVIVDAQWADAIARVFAAEPDADAVTGLVVPDAIDHEAERLFERYGGFGRGFDKQFFRVNSTSGERAATRHGGSGRFGTGANMAFRRRVFDRVGLFDPALDVGTVTNGGGDLDMFFRVLKHGGTLVYDPSALVRHRHRRSYAKLREQIANNGVGFYAYLVRSAGAYEDERAAFLRLAAWWMGWWNLRRLARSFVRADVPRDLILAELIGSLRGPFRYAPARRRSEAIAASFGAQRPYGAILQETSDAARS